MDTEQKTAFAMQKVFYEQASVITNEEKRLRLLEAVMRYAFYGEYPCFADIDTDACLEALFVGMRIAIDEAEELERQKPKRGRKRKGPKTNAEAIKSTLRTGESLTSDDLATSSSNSDSELASSCDEMPKEWVDFAKDELMGRGGYDSDAEEGNAQIDAWLDGLYEERASDITEVNQNDITEVNQNSCAKLSSGPTSEPSLNGNLNSKVEETTIYNNNNNIYNNIYNNIDVYSESCLDESNYNSAAANSEAGIEHNQDSVAVQSEGSSQQHGLKTSAEEKKQSADVSKATKQQGNFVVPTIDEVRAYIKDKGCNVDADRFWYYYDSLGWKVGGKSKMANWHSAVATWARNAKRYDEAQWASGRSTKIYNADPQSVMVGGKEISLGTGERITQEGVREYEWNGKYYKVPLEAKPRPDLRYFWDAEYAQWNCTL